MSNPVLMLSEAARQLDPVILTAFITEAGTIIAGVIGIWGKHIGKKKSEAEASLANIQAKIASDVVGSLNKLIETQDKQLEKKQREIDKLQKALSEKK